MRQRRHDTAPGAPTSGANPADSIPSLWGELLADRKFATIPGVTPARPEPDRPRLAHLTTVDMSLALLLSTELSAAREAGYEVFGISAPGPYIEQVQALGVAHVPLAHLARSWSLRADARAFVDLIRALRTLRPDILPALLLQTDDTQLQGSLTFHLERRSGDARLNLSLPGGTVTLAGQISESQGAGALAAQVTDASLAARWLASWPGMPTQWAQGTMRGSAALNATWKGGWKEQGRQLQVQAQLAVPRLDLGAPGAAPTQVWQVSDGQFDLTGTLASLRLNTRGRALRHSRCSSASRVRISLATVSACKNDVL